MTAPKELSIGDLRTCGVRRSAAEGSHPITKNPAVASASVRQAHCDRSATVGSLSHRRDPHPLCMQASDRMTARRPAAEGSHPITKNPAVASASVRQAHCDRSATDDGLSHHYTNAPEASCRARKSFAAGSRAATSANPWCHHSLQTSYYSFDLLFQGKIFNIHLHQDFSACFSNYRYEEKIFYYNRCHSLTFSCCQPGNIPRYL